MNELEKIIDELGMLELYSYPQEDQKRFWQIYNEDMPKQLAKLKATYQDENDIKLMSGILEGVDIDKTIQYGELLE